MNISIEKCPLCANDLVVTKLYCNHCGTILSGQFGAPSSIFGKLSEEQTDFLLTFIRCEGKFNRMEEELGISYPTLKNRFNDILAAMGYDEAQSQAANQLTTEERMMILKKLDQGELKPEEAELLLRGE
ncbi:MAG TPA: DUF2089 domain-containing protein [Pelolinea sp.]|nr:DUF2089 domain-containing protein [Pelolinea sp.]